MENPQIVIGLAAILILGILARWISWRLKLPAILVLLLTGLAAGPFSGFLKPDEIFGEMLFPIVSFSVAIILFEGALDLKLDEVRRIGRIVRNLLTIGLLATWILAALAAYYLLEISIHLSLLIGAILTVTGPTVVTPLLRFVRPAGETSSILKWEGLVVDPIGAVLAVLVYEIIAPGKRITDDATFAAFAVGRTILVGGGLGWLAARLLTFIISRGMLPRSLHNPFAFMSLITVFAVSNLAQKEAGLLAVTVMGFMLANSRGLDVEHIVEFKENLRVLLIASLFIILAARIDLNEIRALDPVATIAFILALILVVRPVSVLLATIGSSLSWREKVFIGAMAPRGIVAAAVSAILGLELVRAGRPEGQQLAPIIFAVIVGTVSVYSLIALPLVRLLGLRPAESNGLLVLGAHDWCRDFAAALVRLKLPVTLIDTNRENVRQARLAGQNAIHGNVLEDGFIDKVDLTLIGSFLAMTSNDEVNALAALQLQRILGAEKVYQLCPPENEARPGKSVSRALGGLRLFERDLTFQRIGDYVQSGWEIHATTLTREFDFQKMVEHYRGYVTPLVVRRQQGGVQVLTAETNPTGRRFHPGDALVSLVRPTAES